MRVPEISVFVAPWRTMCRIAFDPKLWTLNNRQYLDNLQYIFKFHSILLDFVVPAHYQCLPL